jgi:hypothetical protein
MLTRFDPSIRGAAMGPTEILVSGGVAAILAAIAGGGLKAFGVEVPLLASVRRQALLVLVGAVLIALGLFAPHPPGKAVDAPPRSAPASASAAAAPVSNTSAAGPARPEVPNIHGLPLAAARQFLIQNSWAPITSASSPMANDRLGLRQQEVFDSGFFEAVSCSGGGMAPCMFRYRNPQGFVLEVVSVGEDMQQAIVNSATILDCSERPEAEGCL